MPADILSITLFYLLVALTGFPFLFFCVNGLWGLIRRSWVWDRKRKLLVVNVLIYPLVFCLVFIVLFKAFGIDDEMQRSIAEMEEINAEAIEQGGDPNQHNSILGRVFIGGVIFGLALIPTVILAFIYSVVSILLIMRTKPVVHWSEGYVAGLIVTFLFIGFGYAFRTPIFNWLGL